MSGLLLSPEVCARFKILLSQCNSTFNSFGNVVEFGTNSKPQPIILFNGKLLNHGCIPGVYWWLRNCSRLVKPPTELIFYVQWRNKSSHYVVCTHLTSTSEFSLILNRAHGAALFYMAGYVFIELLTRRRFQQPCTGLLLVDANTAFPGNTTSRFSFSYLMLNQQTGLLANPHLCHF